MTKQHGILLTCLLWCGLACAAPPSDASLEEMMSIGNVHQLLDSVKTQMDGISKGAVNQALQGKELTPERQAIIERMQDKIAVLMHDTLDWDTLKPMFFRVYRQSFTQEDVDGIIAFYKSPAGQAMISKMPLVMQNMMSEMTQMMKPMQQKMLEIQHETLEEMKKTASP